MEYSLEELSKADLQIDRTFRLKEEKQTVGDDPISKLLGVGNMGGIRKLGSGNNEKLAALCMAGAEPNWNDELDVYTGVLTYYGDNRKSGAPLLETKPRGNQLFQNAFELASGDKESRIKCPVFFVFESTGVGREQMFKGIAVPGARDIANENWLTAIWRVDANGRFQNYRATFTILDVPNVKREWIEQLKTLGPEKADKTLAPAAYLDWTETGKIKALTVEPKRMFRSEADQLPVSEIEKELISAIYRFCDSDPFKFEVIAAQIWKLSCLSHSEFEMTRPYRDGGRDAVGYLQLGPSQDPVRINFALEAKLYKQSNGVGVKEIARLISRLKYREFGVLVTTSYVAKQAYEEIRNDGHPVIVVSGKDIANILLSNGITPSLINHWLETL